MLTGFELTHMIWRGQLRVERILCPAQAFHSLAAYTLLASRIDLDHLRNLRQSQDDQVKSIFEDRIRESGLVYNLVLHAHVINNFRIVNHSLICYRHEQASMNAFQMTLAGQRSSALQLFKASDAARNALWPCCTDGFSFFIFL